jgi:hypothetical protein
MSILRPQATRLKRTLQFDYEILWPQQRVGKKKPTIKGRAQEILTYEKIENSTPPLKRADIERTDYTYFLDIF